jgi:hypothetical protein
MAGQKDGDAFAREPAHERAHVAHTGRIEPGRRLVE